MAALPTTFEDLWEVWAVRSAVDELPEAERVVVELLHYRGRTMPEAAAELGIPLGTVKSAPTGPTSTWPPSSTMSGR